MTKARDLAGGNTPNFSVALTSDQTNFTDNSARTIEFNSVQYDSDSAWDSQNYYWVVPTAGKYLITVKARLTGNTNTNVDDCTLYIYGGSSSTTGLDFSDFSTNTYHHDTINLSVNGVYNLAAGDKIKAQAKIDSSSGSGQRVNGNATWKYTKMTITKIIE